MSDDKAPMNGYEAIVWLRRRHEWLNELMTRAVGLDDGRVNGYEWVEMIVDGFSDLARLNERWDEYERRNRRPGYDAPESEVDRWYDDGPKCETATGRAIGPMSSGEKRILRLMTTLGTGSSDARCLAGWIVDDVDFDERGAAIVEDWIAVVRAQLTALQH